MAETKTDDKAKQEAGVATEKQNEKLEHSQGGATTRDDQLDAGVPMKQGDPSEPQGPEDALGEGQKRGDYRNRIHTDPHTSEPIPEGEREEGGPTSRLVPQAPRTEEIGDVAGKKGGVETADV